MLGFGKSGGSPGLKDLSGRVSFLEDKFVGTLEALTVQRYRVEITLKNCLNHRGFRYLVYKFASELAGFYTSEDREKSIGYSGNDLVLDIAFSSYENAHKFVELLEELGPEDDEDFELVTGVKYVEDSGNYGPDAGISKRHYKSKESNSPPQSFSAGPTTEFSVVSGDSWEAVFQAVEPPSKWFDKAHAYGKKLPPRDDLPPKHVTNPNNITAMNATLHRLYDGFYNGPPAVFRVKPTKIWEAPVELTHLGKTQTRYRVDLLMDFQSREEMSQFNGCFKSDAIRGDVQTEWTTFVHVLNPHEYWAYMMWKYEDTTDKWP